MADATLALSGTVPASGTVTLTVRPTNRKTWIIKQVGIEAPNVGGSATGIIRLNDNPVTPFVPQLDAPSSEPFIPVGSGDRFTITWAAATVGATVKALVIYDDGT